MSMKETDKRKKKTIGLLRVCVWVSQRHSYKHGRRYEPKVTCKYIMEELCGYNKAGEWLMLPYSRGSPKD